MERAGFGIRLAAFVIDNIIHGFLYSLVNLVISLVSKTGQAVDPVTGLPEIGIGTWVSVVISLVMAFVYYVYVPLRTNGQTLGKKFTGIRVAKADNNPLTAGTLFLREFIGKFISGILLLIGYLMALGKERRALHDYMAGTVVIKG